MFRVAATACMMLAQLAGPLLCCCSTSRAAAAVPARTEKPAPAARSCCGERPEAPEPQKAPEEQQPARLPHCPCQQALAQTAGLRSQENEAAQRLQDDRPCPDHLAPPMTSDVRRLLDLALGATPNRTALPFLTADDLLRVLHILRC
jgi:hypothetical protein